MRDPICTIHGLNLLNPLFYTKEFLENDYVTANDLAKHLHFYDHEISRIEYLFFYGLKSKIKTITQQIILEKERHSNLSHVKTIYSFSENLELIEIIEEQAGEIEKITLLDSLKKPKSIQISKTIKDALSSLTEIFFDEDLQYEKIIGQEIYSSRKSEWIRSEQKTSKYIVNSDKKIQKILIRNNKYEQSKTVITYKDKFQFIDAKTFSQKNKDELIYEAEFIYDPENKLTKISYKHNKPAKHFSKNWIEEVCFSYDTNGLLIQLEDKFQTKTWTYDSNKNVLSSKVYDKSGLIKLEKNNTYVYDKKGNWTRKVTEEFRFENQKKIRIVKTKSRRQFVYFGEHDNSSLRYKMLSVFRLIK
ncbi:hypothetical protein [Flavobacterium reichenbachii]|uniref:Uncharacterized protein n=1 Tax=Flavobacterium reichenbachii TaxID=362418 RepID=A0A085ZG43_9FLAO|nr:hypothetical protein [Flavobacterium reichenbachii]KFF03407.1 hypothetical protein IW19_21195 [Flavobacterium reichenbachii]OXB16770.1 hypothetical protein B0A68_06480 [Flavobacterium reichenbachii]